MRKHEMRNSKELGDKEDKQIRWAFVSRRSISSSLAYLPTLDGWRGDVEREWAKNMWSIGMGKDKGNESQIYLSVPWERAIFFLLQWFLQCMQVFVVHNMDQSVLIHRACLSPLRVLSPNGWCCQPLNPCYPNDQNTFGPSTQIVMLCEGDEVVVLRNWGSRESVRALPLHKKVETPTVNMSKSTLPRLFFSPKFSKSPKDIDQKLVNSCLL